MSRKLHKFQTEAEYQAYSASTEYTTPCVALIVDTNVIYYDYGNNKPQVDMSNLKVESQEISVGGDYFGYSSITKVHYIPSSITSLDYEFSNFSSLKEITCEIPDGVTSMIQTFFVCKNLVKVPNIPSSVKDMTNAFANCKSLVNVPNIPSGVIEMYFTFYGCTSLVKSPSIPESATSLRSTLRACSILKEATFLHTTPPSYFDTLYNCPSLESIYVPDESVDAYKTATGWSEFASKFKPLSSKPSE